MLMPILVLIAAGTNPFLEFTTGAGIIVGKVAYTGDWDNAGANYGTLEILLKSNYYLVKILNGVI